MFKPQFLQKLNSHLTELLKFFALAAGLLLLRYFFTAYVYYLFPSYTWNVDKFIFEPQVSTFYQNKLPQTNLWTLWGKWDTAFYVEIAQNGYLSESYNETRMVNWGFYPLYPILMFVVRSVFWATNTLDSNLYAGILVSLTSFTLALYVWNRVLKYVMGLPDNVRLLSFAFLLCFPSSYFFSLVYTESLFLLLTAITFWALLKKKFFLASIFVGLASVTRLQGILLFVPLFLFVIHEHVGIYKKLGRFVLLCFPGLLTLGLFSLHLYYVTGNFFAMLQIHKTLNNVGFSPFGYIKNYIHQMQGANMLVNAHFLNFAILVFFLVFLIVILVTLWKSFDYIDFVFASYSLVYILFVSGLGLGVSVPRFLVVLFPFVVLLFKRLP